MREDVKELEVRVRVVLILVGSCGAETEKERERERERERDGDVGEWVSGREEEEEEGDHLLQHSKHALAARSSPKPIEPSAEIRSLEGTAVLCLPFFPAPTTKETLRRSVTQRSW